jgi:hypothetical protein
MGWCYVVILIEFCIPSICLLCLDSDYRKDKNRNINIFDCYFAFLSMQCLLMVGGLPVVSHLSFFLCSALDSGVWRCHYFLCVYEAKTLSCLGLQYSSEEAVMARMGGGGVQERQLHPLGRCQGQERLLCPVVRCLPPPYFAAIFSSIFSLPIRCGSSKMIMLSNIFVYCSFVAS